jgi:hypothetical protein
MKSILKVAVFLALPILYISGLHAGWNVHPDGGLVVRIDYMDVISRDPMTGHPVYNRGDTVHYRITIMNSGKKGFKNFPIQGSLWWKDEVTCNRYWSDNQTVTFTPLEMLPGDSVSGPHRLTIEKDSYSFFDGFYTIPDAVCPGAVQIRLDAGHGGKADSMKLPHLFVIR